jgi:TorA maturation chaperone TorD
MTDSASNDAIDRALARAVVYRALSLAFQAPDEARLQELGVHDGFKILAAGVRGLARTNPELESIAGRLAACTVPTPDEVETAFTRLFGHTARGLISACETEYGPANGFHQPQQLADIAGYYRAFGLTAVPGSEARVDHVACECEFMDFLSRKEAVLLTRFGPRPRGRAATRELRVETELGVTREAARTFLRDHLARFGRAFATQVIREDNGVYGLMAELLLALLDAECRRVGVVAGPIDMAVGADFVDQTPMACGSGDELIQIRRSAEP